MAEVIFTICKKCYDVFTKYITHKLCDTCGDTIEEYLEARRKGLDVEIIARKED